MVGCVGVQVASVLVQSLEPTTRRCGMLALAHFVQVKVRNTDRLLTRVQACGLVNNLCVLRVWLMQEGKAALKSEGVCKGIRDACERLASSHSAIDLDTCRLATWLLYELSRSDDEELREALLQSGALAPLMRNLSMSDRVVKKFAAKAIFNLVDTEKTYDRARTNSSMLAQVGLVISSHQIKSLGLLVLTWCVTVDAPQIGLDLLASMATGRAASTSGLGRRPAIEVRRITQHDMAW